MKANDAIRVMWVTNVELPKVARYFSRETVIGGWMDLSSQLLGNSEKIQLCILSMSSYEYEVELDGILYASFNEKNFCDLFIKRINAFSPELIHVWGTEYKHAFQAAQILESKGMIDRLIMSIQGLVSVYPNHYFAYLPYGVVKKKTLVELLLKRDLLSKCKKMKNAGIDEVNSLRIAKNCIGRTDWDYACANIINPHIRYYECNEILRKSFYEIEWDVSSCEKDVIAFSQANYPIKGLHIMLEALAILKSLKPNIKLKVLGDSPSKKKTIRGILEGTTYADYLKKLISRYKLSENIEFMGRLNEEKMASFLSKANVFVCASSIENSSNSIAEAMLIGMPIVASDVGGIKSFFTHEKDGLLYQADASYMLAFSVLKILNDPLLAKRLGNSARKRAMNDHDPNILTDKMINIYYDVLGRGGNDVFGNLQEHLQDED